MSYEPKPNTGSLWREAKEKVSNKTGQPYKYYSGDATIECPHCKTQTAYWQNAFLNTAKTKDGDKEVYNQSYTPKQKPESTGSGESVPF